MANMACRYVFSISITVVSTCGILDLAVDTTDMFPVQQMDVPRRGRQKENCLPLPSVHDLYTHGGAVQFGIPRPLLPPSHATWTRFE